MVGVAKVDVQRNGETVNLFQRTQNVGNRIMSNLDPEVLVNIITTKPIERRSGLRCENQATHNERCKRPIEVEL